MTRPPRILVIKLSALGDLVLAFPAFARIRIAHPDAHITLLTTAPYASLTASCPWFDAVDADGRPRGVAASLALFRRIRRGRFDRIYDLQANDRTNLLFQALRPLPPEWSGVAFGCALPDRGPRMTRHTLERQAGQLQAAGIWPDAPTAPGTAPRPDLSWLLRQAPQAPAEALARSRPIALLAPGAAPTRPAKLWPAEAYADLARRLDEIGMAVMIVGGPAERDIARTIAAATPGVLDLTGRTDFAAVAALGARAAVAVGNDTGPMHLIAAAGAPSVSLFSTDSDPALCAPRGRVTVLREPRLADLPVERVWRTVLAAVNSPDSEESRTSVS